MYNFLNFELTKEKIKEINQLEFCDKKSRIDLTGQIFHRLTVLGRGPDYISPSGKRSAQWWCICSCPEHKIILVRSNNLKSGNTKSCGCWKSEQSRKHIMEVGHSMAHDISNQVFGELTALEPTNGRRNNSVIWKCRCSCGKIHYVSLHDLNNHRIESCGHTYESKGIRKIKKILNENNIPYTTEKCFSTCKFPDSNASARFDFYINDSFLLEYDGEQHYYEQDLNFFKDSLLQRQQHDLYKNQWCKENNISLKRIPYWELNNITLETIMGDKYLI